MHLFHSVQFKYSLVREKTELDTPKFFAKKLLSKESKLTKNKFLDFILSADKEFFFDFSIIILYKIKTYLNIYSSFKDADCSCDHSFICTASADKCGINLMKLIIKQI